ncbi:MULTISPECIES: IS256 family transposase [unclassified Paenibacillus]|uniref:IS256 family transposase n=1 Tax=unclassified Paenibacillus TaxID=185978 RepID=UPI0024057245|nr:MULTISPECIES: IS256 family transposase [unclassified Paenibacillus]MDF9845576.1 putative transposase [Paenibacillus sp. PastF-2]MDF9852149.1 putative transposase [Paenibacillus sp. PastM-2]MDF9858724.1 putative transposase [Paenibacillus sp. PastF-1]MDH6483983.1 putative transposase [Paenibacillus sp. PastH-2]MDH6511366.1 putative transposase [Paenibacillus sp. PastM-3]
MTQFQITLDADILHQLFIGDSRDAGIAALLETVFNQVLKAQSAEQLGADKYERNEDRTALRNGYYERGLTTRVGKLTLNVPRHRDGSFSTELFTRYQRSEQALLLSLMEMVIQGVSTRKVANITEELCGTEFSKSTVSELCKSLDPVVQAWNNRPLIKAYPFVLVDAMYVKVREDGRVRSRGVLVATGVNEDGKREILGLAIGDTESEATWGGFFAQLKARGLAGVDIVTSDQHSGLVRAVKQQFQGVTWQRCQTHFMRNILDAAPKALRDEVKRYVRSIFEAADMSTARTLLKQTLARFQDAATKAMVVLEEGFDDATAVLELPEACRVRTRTTNIVERLNREIRRRESVISIFPNRDSVIRLLGSVLMEVDECWSEEKRFIDMRTYVAWKKEKR